MLALEANEFRLAETGAMRPPSLRQISTLRADNPRAGTPLQRRAGGGWNMRL